MADAANQESFDSPPICQSATDAFLIGAMPNIIPDQHSNEFLEEAKSCAEQRLAMKYDLDGKIGGEFDAEHPPPGKRCGGYLKGNMGIIWKEIDSVLDDDEPKTGYCGKCGYSLFHYAGKPCSRDSEGSMHPIWSGNPPPSFAEENK